MFFGQSMSTRNQNFEKRFFKMINAERLMKKYEDLTKEHRFFLLDKLQKEENWDEESLKNLYELCESLGISYKYEFSEDEKEWLKEMRFSEFDIEEIRKEEEERNFMFPDDLLFKCEIAIKRLYPEGE